MTDPRDILQQRALEEAQKAAGKPRPKGTEEKAPVPQSPGKLPGEGISDVSELERLVALIKANEAARGDADRQIVIGEFSVPASRVPATFIEQLQHLTRMEAAVTRLLGWGRTNADMAMLLDCSESTVRTHMNNVIRKLELDGMRELMTLAGLLFHPLD